MEVTVAQNGKSVCINGQILFYLMSKYNSIGCLRVLERSVYIILNWASLLHIIAYRKWAWKRSHHNSGKCVTKICLGGSIIYEIKNILHQISSKNIYIENSYSTSKATNFQKRVKRGGIQVNITIDGNIKIQIAREWIKAYFKTNKCFFKNLIIFWFERTG